MIYLDNAASTAIHDDVFEEMLPFLKEAYGNPSSIHTVGRRASTGIQVSRKRISELVNCLPEEIFFTSGGTESNNTAISGVASANRGKRIITSSIEHDAVLEPCKRLEDDGYQIIYLPVDNRGLINPSDLEKSISEDTCLVSIMWANNEVGTIQPIAELAKICNEKKILFHTDAIQALGKTPIDLKEIGVDLLSVSSHKIYGPKGVGALFIRKGVKINPIILGGGQEKGFRSGTENVASIIGFGKAAELARLNLKKNLEHMKELRNHLIAKIQNEIPHVKLNGDSDKRLVNNIHLTFLGVKGEDLILKLDEHGIAASTGSACSVNRQRASHVLRAMGLDHEQIEGSLRLSLGIFNSQEEIDNTIKTLKKIVSELRQVSPLREKYDF